MLRFNLAELRRRGYDEDTFSDEQLVRAMDLVFEIIYLFTNRDFDIHETSLELDGDGTSELYIPIPIIEITSVTIEDYGEVDSDDYVVYNRAIPDDRECPMVVLKSGNFPKGNQNVSVEGTYGYVNGNMPPSPLLEVSYRILSKVFEPLLDDADVDIDTPLDPDEIMSQTTDRWTYKKFDRESLGSVFGNFVTAVLIKYSKGNDIISGGWV
ncbi:MAG: hypothetical protein HKP62_02310 [Sulfurovum sp.]|nr:hypothetical protein [Sulfurovum sp.]NNJ44826.1 hypothetical protein [Sulfurovum sp.]